jgi:hypothetical protein
VQFPAVLLQKISRQKLLRWRWNEGSDQVLFVYKNVW